MFPQYSSNMSLVNPNDFNLLKNASGFYNTGLTAAQPTNTEYAPFGGDNAGGAEYAPFGGDTKPSGTEYAPFGGDEAPAATNTPQSTPEGGIDAKNMEAYRMMARGIQGMNRQQAFPSGNTAQIIRDNNQFRFAGYQGTPQQQMANALRNRG